LQVCASPISLVVSGSGFIRFSLILYVCFLCGLPESSKYHALKMAKFASSCLDETTVITQRLELSLGPGTADLAFALRLGLYSGPKIAGGLETLYVASSVC
jgi:hypothetical protein